MDAPPFNAANRASPAASTTATAQRSCIQACRALHMHAPKPCAMPAATPSAPQRLRLRPLRCEMRRRHGATDEINSGVRHVSV